MVPVDEYGREYDESWDTISGLVDDIDAVVVSSKFGYMDEYHDRDGNPQCLMILTLQEVQQDGQGWRTVGDPFEQVWSTGKGWEPADNGKVAVHVAGRRKFIASSMYGMLLNRVKSLWPDVKFRGVADRAGILDGTVWHWVREKIEYGGRLEEREHLMPVKFLGEMKRVAKAAKPAASDAVSDAAEEGDWETRLNAYALTSENHAEFVKMVLADKPLVDSIKAAGRLREVLDKSGYWAKARAE